MTDNTEPTQHLSTTLSIYEEGLKRVNNFYVKYGRRKEVYVFTLVQNPQDITTEKYSLRRGDDVQARTPDQTIVQIYHDAAAIPPTGLGKLYLVMNDGKTVGINYD